MLAPRGVGTMVAMMIAGRLMGKVDVRLMIFFGLAMMGWSLWQTSLFTLDIPQSLLVTTGIAQGFGMGFVFIPLSTIAYATLEPRYRADATAFFSLVRNIGSSIGISIMIALLDMKIPRSTTPQLTEHITPFTRGLNVINAFALQFGVPQIATTAAVTMIDGEVNRQAAAIAYLNDFRLMIWVTVICMPLLLLMKKPDHAPKPEEKAMALE